MKLSERWCRLGSTHDSHDYIQSDISYWCPGVPCDHDNACCVKHKLHVEPHRGCILR